MQPRPCCTSSIACVTLPGRIFPTLDHLSMRLLCRIPVLIPLVDMSQPPQAVSPRNSQLWSSSTSCFNPCHGVQWPASLVLQLWRRGCCRDKTQTSTLILLEEGFVSASRPEIGTRKCTSVDPWAYRKSLVEVKLLVRHYVLGDPPALTSWS